MMRRTVGLLLVSVCALGCDETPSSSPAPASAPPAKSAVERTSEAPSSCLTRTPGKRTLCSETIGGDLTEEGKERLCEADKGAFRHRGCPLDDSFGYCETTPGGSTLRTYWYGQGGESFRRGCEVAGAGKFVATPAVKP